MKKQIILLAISILGAFSLHAQEINEGLVQSKQEVISQPRKGTDWNKQPIGYVFAGAGIGYIPSVEKVEGLAASNYVTGLESRNVSLLQSLGMGSTCTAISFQAISCFL